MKALVYQVLLLALGLGAAWIGRDPSIWFAASLVVAALARGKA